MLSANQFMQFLSGTIMPAARPANGQDDTVLAVGETASSLLSGEHANDDVRARISEMLSRLETASPDNSGGDSEFARTFLTDLQSLLSPAASAADWFMEAESALNLGAQPTGGLMLFGSASGEQALPWTLDELAQLAQKFLVDGKQLPEAAWQDGQNLPQQLAALLAGFEQNSSVRMTSADLSGQVQNPAYAATPASHTLVSGNANTVELSKAPLSAVNLTSAAVQVNRASADMVAGTPELADTAASDTAARVSVANNAAAAQTAALAPVADAASVPLAGSETLITQDPRAPAQGAIAATAAAATTTNTTTKATTATTATGAADPAQSGVNTSVLPAGTGPTVRHETAGLASMQTSAASTLDVTQTISQDDGMTAPVPQQKVSAEAAVIAAAAPVNAAVLSTPVAEPRRSMLAEQLSSAGRRGADAGTTTLNPGTSTNPQSPAGFALNESMTASGGNLSLAIEQAMADAAGSDSNSPARQESSLLKSATPTAQELAAELFGADQRRATPQTSATLSNAAAMAPTARAGDASLMLQAGSFGQAGWGENIARQLMVMTANGVNSAQIRLDPPELGTLTVRVQLIDQAATVNFVSQHAMVRDALDAQIPRLQELFRNEGMDLLDVTVSDQQTSGQGDGRGDQDRGSRRSRGEQGSDMDNADALARVSARSLHLVDEHV